jgi:hypothetical protein
LCIIIISLTLLCSGCQTAQPIKNTKWLPSEHTLKEYDSFHQVLKDFFTPEALEAVKDIPVVDGFMIRPNVIGVNFWSSIAGLVVGNGFGRRVIMSREYILDNDCINTLLHEYIHHLDDMDRDDKQEWIDHREFALVFRKLMQDERYKSKIRDFLYLEDSFITSTFGIGNMSELIAYVGSWVARGNGPNYVKKVYRKILKLEPSTMPQAN